MLSILNQLLESGIIYIIIYLILLIHALLDFTVYRKRYAHLISFMGICILILLLSLRWEIGTDWAPYKELFEGLELNFQLLLDVYHFDLGYTLFNALVRLFTDSYTCFLLINSILGLGLLYYFLIKYTTYPNISIYILYCCYFMSHFMGGNRRMIAIVGILYFIYYVFKKDRNKALFWLLFSFFFHRSSLVCLIVCFVPREMFSPKKIIWLICISLFLGITQLPFKLIDFIGNSLIGVINHPIVDAMTLYTNKDKGYINPENINPVFQTIASLIKRGIVLYIIYFSTRKFKYSTFDYYLINLYIISMCVYSIFAGNGVLQVLSTYLAVLEIVIFARIFINYNSKYKLLYFAFLLLYGFLQLLNSFTAYPELYIPYKNILTNA